MIDQTSNAYVDAMKAEHRDLAERVHRLEILLKEAMARGWPMPLADELAEQLRRLEGALTEHFAREEQGGFLEEATAHAPRFGPQAERLLDEHVDLLASVRDLVRQAGRNMERTTTAWQLFSQALAAVLKRLLTHEATENALLQKAFNVEDVGPQ